MGHSHTFNDIFILNLHGYANKEVCPDGSKDENVFDIKQGVTIGIFIKEPEKKYPAQVKYKDIWGLRDDKYDYLSSNTLESTEWTDITPNEPNYFFVPKDETLRKEYERYPKLDEIFQAFSIGMITARDRYVIDFEKEPLLKRVTEFQKSTLNDEKLCEDLGIPMKKGWDIKNARILIQQEKDLSAHIRPLLYRPFDIRPVFYHRSLVWSMSYPVMRNMLNHDNLALITSRMTKGETYQHTLVSNTVSEVILLSPKTSNNAFVFPLYIHPSEGEMQLGSHPNFKQDFVDTISAKLKLEFINNGSGDFIQTLGPEDIFNYAYAVFQSHTYRAGYAEFLKTDFPRLPLISDRELFRALASKGAELVGLHLMESPVLS